MYHQFLASPRLGGAEKLGIAIQKFLSASREEATSRLLLPARSDLEELARSASLDFGTYRLDWLLGKGHGRPLAANAALAIKMSRYRSGILHVHSPFAYSALTPLLAISRLKTVLHIHLDYLDSRLAHTLAHPPDLVIACGQFIRTRIEYLLAQQSASRTRVTVISNAVDTAQFFPFNRRQAKARLQLDPDRTLIAVVANLAPHKGQDTAIRAVAALVRRGARPLLWLVGEERDPADNYAGFLQDLVAQLGVGEFVEFVGFRRDVPYILQAADFLLLPSTQEGLPLVILEAQACRSIVLAAPTAGIPEVIEDGRTGFLLAADDWEGYAARLEALIADEAAAAAVADTAAALVQARSTFARYSDQLVAEYDQLVRPSAA